MKEKRTMILGSHENVMRPFPDTQFPRNVYLRGSIHYNYDLDQKAMVYDVRKAESEDHIGVLFGKFTIESMSDRKILFQSTPEESDTRLPLYNARAVLEHIISTPDMPEHLADSAIKSYLESLQCAFRPFQNYTALQRSIIGLSYFPDHDFVLIETGLKKPSKRYADAASREIMRKQGDPMIERFERRIKEAFQRSEDEFLCKYLPVIRLPDDPEPNDDGPLLN